MSQHQKRINAPVTWPIKRKEHMFTTRLNPGPKKKEEAVSLNFFLREMAHVTRTTREAKKLLQTGAVLVNNIVRKDHHFPVGLFDIILFKPTKEFYTIIFSSAGKLEGKKLKDIVLTRFAKVIGKTVLKGKKTQLNLSDGTNLLVEKDSGNLGDTAVFEEKKIIKVIRCEKGANVYLTDGKHKGKNGIIEEVIFMNTMQEHRIVVKTKNEKFETLKRYAFVVENPIGEQ